MPTNRASRIFLGIFFAIFVAPALAHDPNRPELNSWFDHLASGYGPCCSNADGTALSDVDWQSKDGHYRVRLDGQWIDVPDDAVVTVPNLVGRTMVWPMPPGYDYEANVPSPKIRCFMPGSMI